MIRYTHDGRTEIDNNAAERSIRGIALGRKNYLFAGSDAGGERAATIYSLIETARLNSMDPEDICAMSSHALPIIPSIVSPTCCRGNGRQITPKPKPRNSPDATLQLEMA